MPLIRAPLWRALVAVVSGVFTLLAFAPFSFYPLAVVGPAVLLLLWLDAAPGRAFLEGWLFGLGLMGFGVSWLHISIDEFGNVGTPLAVFITTGFIFIASLYYGLVGWLGGKLRGRGLSLWHSLFIFSGLWVLAEWLRGWLFTGFPWLSLGYSQIDSSLAGWAPLTGIYGVSWAVLLSATSLVIVLRGGGRTRWIALAGFFILWGGGTLLKKLEWTEPSGAALKVALIQGNVLQHEKWQPRNLLPTLEKYVGLSRRHWDADLIIWPETAVPAFAHRVESTFLIPLRKEAIEQGTTLLLGIPMQSESGHFYNGMLALGETTGVYHKRHLVPFGEYMPLDFLLKPLLDWLQIPMSDFSAGRVERPLLTLAGVSAGISICYEDAFGEEVIQALPDARLLINASNDAWFGDSLAPLQHLEMARMRALESGRYLVRSTNTGISALIDPQGRIVSKSPAFEQHVLRGEAVPMKGSTAYSKIGNWGILCILTMVLALVLAVKSRAPDPE
ncbi:MAG: apolipoprotein N-acyltransferase [Gammaproteobacteria bacterium]|nr:apolipoprotein N-acyltransferase [Gammaproteobacteria bacterium]